MPLDKFLSLWKLTDNDKIELLGIGNFEMLVARWLGQPRLIRSRLKEGQNGGTRLLASVCVEFREGSAARHALSPPARA